MRVPKGRPVHENLNTSYLKVGALLADLQVRQFTGYVHIGLRGYDAYVFLDDGQIAGAVEQMETGTRTGSAAIDGLLLRSEQRDGAVSIYEHPAATVEAIAGIIEGTPVYQNLSSDFTDLDKLIRKLAQDRDSIWYVEVAATEDLGVGVLYIRDGKPDGVYSPLDSPTQHGEDAIKTMLEVSEAFGATYNVYAVAAPAVVSAAPAATPRLAVVSVAEPTPAAEPEPDVEVEPVEVEADAPDAVVSLVPLMSEVISTVEEVVAAREGTGAFAIELRSGLLDVAERYPFLDPFAAEFEYHAGEIVVVGAVDPEELAAGIGEALHLTVSALTRRDAAEGERLRRRIAEAIAALYAERQDEFDFYGLAGLLAFITEPDMPGASATAASEA
jgi:hypothetical protein